MNPTGTHEQWFSFFLDRNNKIKPWLDSAPSTIRNEVRQSQTANVEGGGIKLQQQNKIYF